MEALLGPFLKKVTSTGQGHTRLVGVDSGIQAQVHPPLSPYSNMANATS